MANTTVKDIIWYMDGTAPRAWREMGGFDHPAVCVALV